MIEFIDKTTEQSGTPINRDNLMGIQGFESKSTSIVEDDNGNYTITETNSDNHTLTTTITENQDGSTTIVQVFVGEKTITKTTTVNAQGNIISEAVS